jgi:hypothetical protein
MPLSSTPSATPAGRLTAEYAAVIADLDRLETEWDAADRRGDPAAFARAATLAPAITDARARRDALARELERQRQIAEVAARLDAARAAVERDRRAVLDRLLALADAPTETDLIDLWRLDRALDALVVVLARARADAAPRPCDGLRDVCAALAARTMHAERRAEIVRHRRPLAESPAWARDLSTLTALLAGGALSQGE